MVSKAFSLTKTPTIHFGVEKFNSLAMLITKFGDKPLLVISNSFKSSEFYEELIYNLEVSNIDFREILSKGEPTPEFIDSIKELFKNELTPFTVIVSIGGGSVIDAGKAISATLLENGSVKDYLEDMETRTHSGHKIPFIAVPTTSGTGSEATKNAVISEVGPGGYKKSLRHENFVPDIALVDPRLMASCPNAVTVACGLDTLTQLIEGYVSTESNSLTDSLAISGIQHFAKSFSLLINNKNEDLTARTNLAYASLLSGIVLANAGLGTIHGFSSSIGGFFKIPHGVICGLLLSDVTEVSIKGLFQAEKENIHYIKKYANIGKILSGDKSLTDKEACHKLINSLKELLAISNFSSLSKYGVTIKDIDKIVSETSNKNNPYKLNSGELKEILRSSL